MISLIATVLNEGDNIAHLLDSILAQTCLPDEMIVVDGGSTDQTLEILQRYAQRLPLRILSAPGFNISQGRNLAIAAAEGDIIAVTDAGVRLQTDWLEKLTHPLCENPDVQVVGGFFQADAHNVFEAAMGATVLPLADEIHEENFLPSHRSVAFRRAIVEQVGGYPAWLDYCEDLVLDLKLKQAAPDFAFVPEAVAYFRPRGSLRAFFKQYYRYARGDGKADLWRKRHAIRYATYLLAAPLIFLLGWRRTRALWLLYLPGAAYYLYQPYRRLPTTLSHAPPTSTAGILYAVALVPLIRVVGDVAKMLGYPAGWYWRIRQRPPDWRGPT